MKCSVAAWRAWVPGSLTRQEHVDTAAEPIRPDSVPDAHWRRMGRLGRAVASCAAPLLADLDRATLPVIWGTALGEVDASSVFLDRLAAEGPSRVSPLVFQGSVYNAAVARLSLALGLKGPTETVAAGQATAVAALARGIEWLARARCVLVIAGDESPWAARTAIEAAGARPAEAAVALLLVPGDDVALSDGPDGPAPRWGRLGSLPYEAVARPSIDRAVDEDLGLSAVLPLISWLGAGEGTVIADDDGAALAATWGPLRRSADRPAAAPPPTGRGS